MLNVANLFRHVFCRGCRVYLLSADADADVAVRWNRRTPSVQPSVPDGERDANRLRLLPVAWMWRWREAEGAPWGDWRLVHHDPGSADVSDRQQVVPLYRHPVREDAGREREEVVERVAKWLKRNYRGAEPSVFLSQEAVDNHRRSVDEQFRAEARRLFSECFPSPDQGAEP